MNPNFEAGLRFFENLIANTSTCQLIFSAGLIAVIGYGWRTLWRGIKIVGDVAHHLRSKDWSVN